MNWEEMVLEYKILATRLTAERDMYRKYYERNKETIAAYEELATNAVGQLREAYSENAELAAKLRIANAALEMARKSAAEKDEEMAVLRRDLLRNGYGRDNVSS